MLIKNWMTKDVVTVPADCSMMKASKIMKERGVRRLPVVDEESRLIGIVSDRDIKEASPSKATTLDVHELYYLLSEIKVKDIMTPRPVTIHEDETMERAAAIMLEKRIGGLPVVNDEGRIQGIVSDADIFKTLVRITGIERGGIQIGLLLKNERGSLRSVLDDLRAHGARVISVLTSYDTAPEGHRHVYLRLDDMEKGEQAKLKGTLEAGGKMLYWVRDKAKILQVE